MENQEQRQKTKMIDLANHTPTCNVDGLSLAQPSVALALWVRLCQTQYAQPPESSALSWMSSSDMQAAVSYQENI